MDFSNGTTYPTVNQQTAFVKRSTAMLQKLSYLEHYAWFAFPTNTDGAQGTGLYRPGNTITKPGKAYRAAG